MHLFAPDGICPNPFNGENNSPYRVYEAIASADCANINGWSDRKEIVIKL